MNKEKWVIFDLDGTLALIDERRKVSEKENGKLDWDKFFNPDNIKLDKPNMPVIMMAQALSAFGYKIAILSGRNDISKKETIEWLHKYDIPFNIVKLRPNKHPFKFMDDRKLKLMWFEEMFANEEAEAAAVFDDRQKVVDMWREIGLTCMQVAPGEWPPKNIL